MTETTKRCKILDAGWHNILVNGVRVRTHCVLYKEWQGTKCVKCTLTIPRRKGVARVEITLREFRRQVRKHELMPPRKTLSEEERKERKLQSAGKYREKLREEWQGKAPDFKYRLPDEIKREVYSLIAEDIPNVEIARRLGMSPSQVSRMKHGERGGEEPQSLQPSMAAA